MTLLNIIKIFLSNSELFWSFSIQDKIRQIYTNIQIIEKCLSNINNTQVMLKMLQSNRIFLSNIINKGMLKSVKKRCNLKDSCHESEIVTIHVIFAASVQSDHIAVYTYRNNH